MLTHLLNNIIRTNNLCGGTKAGDPGEKLGTHHNICSDSKMIVSIGNDEDILAKPIQDSAYQMILKAKLDGFLLTGEHPEYLPGIYRHVERLISVQTIPISSVDEISVILSTR